MVFIIKSILSIYLNKAVVLVFLHQFPTAFLLIHKTVTFKAFCLILQIIPSFSICRIQNFFARSQDRFKIIHHSTRMFVPHFRFIRVCIATPYCGSSNGFRDADSGWYYNIYVWGYWTWAPLVKIYICMLVPFYALKMIMGWLYGLSGSAGKCKNISVCIFSSQC